ncbi:NHL repeat protein [Cooperia oncophora]
MEVAKRLDALRASRGLGYNVNSKQEISPGYSMSDDGGDTCESDEEIVAKSSESPIPLESHEKTSEQSNRGDSQSGNTRSDDEKLDEVVAKFSHISLETKGLPNKDDRPSDAPNKSSCKAAAAVVRQNPISNDGSSHTNQAALDTRPLRPAEVKEICTNALKTGQSNHSRTSSDASPFSKIGNELPRDDNSNIVRAERRRDITPPGPFYDEDRIRLTEYIKPYDGIRVSLTGSPSKNCDGKRLNRPLGVTFDEALEQWIVADTGNDRVVLAPSGNVLTSAKMLAPSAVVVLEPGYSFAVLTKRIHFAAYEAVGSESVGLALTPRKNLLILEKIKGFWTICIYEGKPRATLVNSAHYPKIENGLPSFLDVHRDLLIITDLGLALTPRKNLLILEKIKGFWTICIYEGKPRATLVNSAHYPKIENGLPSFLDVHRDLLIITDLGMVSYYSFPDCRAVQHVFFAGAQSLVRFSIDAKTDNLKYEECVFLGSGPKNRGHVEIKYISGVFIDDDENVLIADAKGHSLQVFTSKGVFLHAVKVVSGGLPYISGLWVNRNGYIGACPRAETNGGLYVYRIIVPPQTDYKIPSLRSRAS